MNSIMHYVLNAVISLKFCHCRLNVSCSFLTFVSCLLLSFSDEINLQFAPVLVLQCHTESLQHGRENLEKL